jgi:hypothetical protein
VNHLGPKDAFIGNAQGRTPGVPANLSGKTVLEQYGGSGIDTRPAPNASTPYQDREGNPDEARHVVSQHRYGVSRGAGGVDMNDPAANGSGVIFDGAKAQNGYMPSPASYSDSPVPTNAPWFEGRSVQEENKAHLGQGNENAAQDNLMKILDGVMSRD